MYLIYKKENSDAFGGDNTEGGNSMAYSELIKNFDRIRDYMRQFYIYGFKSRTEYDKKSARRSLS